jgi:hypothetical protein
MEEAKTHTDLWCQQRATDLFIFVGSKTASWRSTVNVFSFLLKATVNEPLEMGMVSQACSCM